MARLKKLNLLFWIILLAVIVTGCGANEEEPTTTAAPEVAPEPTTAEEPSTAFLAPATKADVPRISAEDLNQLIDSGEEIVVIDTRSETSFGYSRIVDAVILDDNNLDSQLVGIPLDQKIVLYCS